MYER